MLDLSERDVESDGWGNDWPEEFDSKPDPDPFLLTEFWLSKLRRRRWWRIRFLYMSL